MTEFSANVPPHLAEAFDAAKRSGGERNGASEYGPGPSRNRAEVAPLVDRRHREGILREPAVLGPHVFEPE